MHCNFSEQLLEIFDQIGLLLQERGENGKMLVKKFFNESVPVTVHSVKTLESSAEAQESKLKISEIDRDIFFGIRRKSVLTFLFIGVTG